MVCFDGSLFHTVFFEVAGRLEISPVLSTVYLQQDLQIGHQVWEGDIDPHREHD